MVNICTESHVGEGYGWQPEQPNEHVSMVHVKLLAHSAAMEIWWDKNNSDTVDIMKDGHTSLALYPPREL